MSKNWEYSAGVIWQELIRAASQKITVNYSDLSPIIATNPLSVGRALGPIQDFCIENRLPPLTSIVVSKSGHKPGNGFIAWDIDNLADAQDLVFQFNWNTIQNPYAGFTPTETTETLAHDIIKGNVLPEDLYNKVKVRGIVQKIFRNTLLNIYDYKCAFCGLSFADALEAAHIIPWSLASKSERLDPANGILLCAVHHKLFDAGLITITESYKIHYYDINKNDGPYSINDENMSVNLHGKEIFLTNKNLFPNINFIKKRNEIDKWGCLP